MGMMDAYFNADLDFYVLFERWHVLHPGGLAGSFFAVFILAVFHEAIKVIRQYLVKKYINNVRHRVVETSSERSLILQQESEGDLPFLSKGHFIQTFLHFVQITLSYSLMLIVMTYNVYLCLAVVIGATFGYFIFAWKITIDVSNQECV